MSAYVADALRHYGRSTTLRELLDRWWADDPAERAGWAIVVPVGPLAQVWRDGAGQVALARFLTATDQVGIIEWDVATARAAGVLCGRTATANVVNASVALCARERDHHVVTSDPKDFALLDPHLSVIVV
ncbi:MAG TPA: hypothetical protein VGJ13_12645 [Pseudonocardiaceae bacterium]